MRDNINYSSISDDLDFKLILILIYFNNKRGYSTYDLMKLLSVNYKTLDLFLETLLELGLIEEDEEISQLKISEDGKGILYKKYMNNINLENLNEGVKMRSDYKLNGLKKENIFFLPRNFKK